MTTLTVQTVLFRDDPACVTRSIASLGAAVRVANDRGVTLDVTLAHGDAGDPGLSTSWRDTFASAAAAGDLKYSYEFFGENSGSARGQNRLAAQHPAQWHFIINPDVVFSGTALAELFARTSDPTIGALEARQLPMPLSKDYDVTTGDTSWASGACSLVRGDVWRSIGGYDDLNFFLYCDDVDLSWRIRMSGSRVVHVVDARVFHDKRLTTSGAVEVSDAEVYHSALASYLMARKWGGSDDVARVVNNIRGDIYAPVRAEIERRRNGGSLPSAVAGAERVAVFARTGHYGEVRYA